MQTVALVILLILAVALIGVVLLQRNEGGGLGMGAGGVMTGRAQATGLARATWWIGGAFMATSLALTMIAAQDAAGTSVVDQINPAANDAFAAARTLGPASPATDALRGWGASRQIGEPFAKATDTNSLWWQWTAPAGGTASVSTCGTGFDSMPSRQTG